MLADLQMIVYAQMLVELLADHHTTIHCQQIVSQQTMQLERAVEAVEAVMELVLSEDSRLHLYPIRAPRMEDSKIVSARQGFQQLVLVLRKDLWIEEE
jgi:hypothetical protein